MNSPSASLRFYFNNSWGWGWAGHHSRQEDCIYRKACSLLLSLLYKALEILNQLCKLIIQHSTSIVGNCPVLEKQFSGMADRGPKVGKVSQSSQGGKCSLKKTLIQHLNITFYWKGQKIPVGNTNFQKLRLYKGNLGIYRRYSNAIIQLFSVQGKRKTCLYFLKLSVRLLRNTCVASHILNTNSLTNCLLPQITI